jgi:methylated-DNA-[protein]-cysteine S-methyltransferase
MDIRLLTARIETPIGELEIAVDGDGNLCATSWAGRHSEIQRWLRRRYPQDRLQMHPDDNPAGMAAAIRSYFDGNLAAIDSLPVETGGTEFQRSVWRELRKIPCGTTISYGELAARIGRPSAVRAVGLANGSNPVGVIVPCHRVIGSDSSLTGYGGGIERKRWLLQHERVSVIGERVVGRAFTTTKNLFS